MAEEQAHAEGVLTGAPKVALLACTRCGVLLWDIEKHYAHAHPESGDSRPCPAGLAGSAGSCSLPNHHAGPHAWNRVGEPGDSESGGFTMTEHLHFVTITHERDEEGDVTDSTLTFECRGDRMSPCHNYPACDCDDWTDGHEHPKVPHDECWMQSWFDVGYEATPHRDDEYGYIAGAPEGSGPIAWEYDECVIWHWLSEDAESGDSESGGSDHG